MTTLLDLRTRARERADMVGSTFVTDSSLTTWINQGMLELYDLVVGSFEDYFSTTTTLTVASGNTVSLPANFYKLRGLDYNNNGQYQGLREFGFAERNSTAPGGVNFLYNQGTDRKYRIMGDNLMLLPETGSVGSYRLFYVPAATAMSADADILPTSLSKFGWDEYIVLFAAERMLSKEESSITDIQSEKESIMRRIIKMASDRQADQSDTVQDVRGLEADSWWYES